MKQQVKYIAKNGIIREINPNQDQGDQYWRAFEDTVTKYATDLPDGEYSSDQITEPVKQGSFSKEFRNSDTETPWLSESEQNLNLPGIETRLFVTAKPKESEPSIHNTDQRFFNHMSEEHGLTLLQSEMHEIANVVAETYGLIPRSKVIEAIEAYERMISEPLDAETIKNIINNIK